MNKSNPTVKAGGTAPRNLNRYYATDTAHRPDLLDAVGGGDAAMVVDRQNNAVVTHWPLMGPARRRKMLVGRARLKARILNRNARIDAYEAETPAAPQPEMWVGIVQGIFGYGMTVVGGSQAEVEKALRTKYAEWKADRAKHFAHELRNEEETTFEGSFEHFGGVIKRITPGTVYFDHFAS